ncbi:phosphate butyryltransferase [Priestia sp. GS2]|uniref:phosphate butyryltransferase n=1 Tax=Priestia sp. GS2 TaxID=3117403 RepID=UPI002EDAC365
MILKQLMRKSITNKQVTIAVAAAEDAETLEAVNQACEYQLARFILYGNEAKIKSNLEQKIKRRLEAGEVTIVHTNSPQQSAQEAVRAVAMNEAHIVMKGHLSTSTILKAVLHKENGLRTGNVLSHVAAFEIPGYDRPIIVTDAAMNIAPNIQEKVQIIENAVGVAQAMGITKPKVAPIAAVEVVNPAMEATTDAALLTQMNKRGQIKGCVVDGPLALDNAISHVAAEQKGIQSEVAGAADILMVPTIESGNILYKSLIYFARAKVGAVIAGAKAPIVLTSRADSAESKLYSLALAINVATHN